MKWNPQTKHPKVYPDKVSVTLQIGSNPHHTRTSNLSIKRSKEVLGRRKHGPTHYRLGDQGWKDYPDSQAGKYKYFLAVYVRYDDGDQGWEDIEGNEIDIDEWTTLEKTVDAGYVW